MRILVTGAKGQVAAALLRAGARQNGIDVTVLGRPDLDLERPNRALMVRVAPDVVVNAAAYTAVDQAENEEERAFSINAERAEGIAAAAASLDLPIIQISTDYVFSGLSRRPYLETDTPDPINAFGRSKLAGEERVAQANPRHVILRTSWIYSDTGRNFVARMLDLAEQQDEVGVVSDQFGSPTPADDIATGILKVASNLLDSPQDSSRSGVFHMTAGGSTSWFGFAEKIFAESDRLGGPVARVVAIASADYPTPAARPQNACLDCARIASVHGVRLAAWEDGVGRAVAGLLERRSGRE